MLIERNRFLVRLILSEIRRRVGPGTSVPRLQALLAAVFERRGQSSTIVLPEPAISMKTWRLATTIEHEKTSTSLW